MVAHCEARGVVLMEAFMWRHQPRTAGAPKPGRGGAIGELRLIRSSFSFPIDPGDWRLDPPGEAGRSGTSAVTGSARRGSSPGPSPSRSGPWRGSGRPGVDLSLTAELKFPDGVLGLIDCSFEQPFRCSYELVGTRGVDRGSRRLSAPANGPSPALVEDRVEPRNLASTGETSTRRWSTPSPRRFATGRTLTSPGRGRPGSDDGARRHPRRGTGRARDGERTPRARLRRPDRSRRRPRGVHKASITHRPGRLARRCRSGRRRRRGAAVPAGSELPIAELIRLRGELAGSGTLS